MRRELSKGKNMLINIKNSQGEKVGDRKAMADVVTAFYRDLYGNGNESETDGSRDEANDQEEEEDFPKILRQEIRNEIQKIKRGKAPGPDKIGINVPNKGLCRRVRETLRNVIQFIPRGRGDSAVMGSV